ncbi:hypothetical protein TanjilG_14414 [Lupinus angustifolius]|uniref:GIR1-like zinc ribbon domain-containing protein n=1 Tax=Lupinus angustifolius TaxID=3871 RepID=A0A1J7H4D0_LUPAN|nr:PREDICTED: uncharacterized protein LOC109352574 [Lupinus angustifolius]OIW07468.1 hypothetical protein TanjilG_14414 [Lupinus angustifolius]
MEKLSGKLQQVHDTHIEKEDEDNNILENYGSASVHQHNRSIDINQPPQIEDQDQGHLSIGHEINFEVKSTSEESKEISVVETMMNEHGSGLGVDLKLKNPSQSSSSRISSLSSTPFNKTSASSMFGSDENLGDASKDEGLPFTLAGCTRCYMYMLVSKDNPRCMICGNRMLIDKFE